MNSDIPMKFDTKVVRAGIEPDPTTGSIVPPIFQTATYVLEEVGKDRGFDYTRASNPTRQVLEDNLAAIEGGKHGICYSSGMSAVDSCMKLLSAGDHVVCSDDVYGGTSRHFNKVLARYGLAFTYVDTSQPETVRQAIRPETKLLWVETPTNPLLKVTDLAEVARLGKSAGIITAVDNTFSSPWAQRPLEFGIDLVMHSVTKYINGHSDMVGGIVVVGDRDDLAERLEFMQNAVGSILG